MPFEVADRLRVEQAAVDGSRPTATGSTRGSSRSRASSCPGGVEAAARLHVARSVCRRAEREALAASGQVEINPLALVYLNRLSDLLFILARAANAADGAGQSRSGSRAETAEPAATRKPSVSVTVDRPPSRPARGGR